MDRCCKNCCAFHSFNRSQTFASGTFEVGECRLRMPTIIDCDKRLHSIWPDVHEHKWCLEFVPKPEGACADGDQHD